MIADSAGLGRVKRVNLTVQVMDSIKHFIVTNDLKAGDRLPTEKEFVDTLGISRNVLREALKSLEAIGLLEIRVGAGIYVSEFDYASVMSHISFAVSRTRHELKSFMYAREIIEVGALDYIMERVTEEDIARLQKTVERWRTVMTYEQNAEVDQQFHRVLLAISGNPVLEEFATFLRQFFIEVLYYRGQGRTTSPADDHAEIIEVLQTRDLPKAKKVLRDHIFSWEPFLDADPAVLRRSPDLLRAELMSTDGNE